MEPVAPVFDIQRFSLHDGPGIRSLVFLKGCGLHCPWCQNPESQSARAVIGFHRNRCLESFECESVCPNDAILRGEHRVDHQLCNRCGLCIEACPSEALELIGETVGADDLMERLLVDRDYYDSSGGGVTFTGGEPTLHALFLTRVLELCSAAGIHTNIETAGRFSWPTLEPALGLTDLIYFDLKILDPEAHRRELGGDLDEILDNARRLADGGFPVEFRMPAVAGYTDTTANVDAVTAFLRVVGHRSIRLLPYHNMGEAKIDMIAGDQPRLGLPRYPDERMDALKRDFESRGVVAT